MVFRNNMHISIGYNLFLNEVNEQKCMQQLDFVL